MTTKPPPAREARATAPMTAREARFVEQYRLHGNATRAAREAGYAGHQAGAIGWTLLRKPKIIAALAAHGIEIVLTPKTTSQFQTNVKTYRRKGLTLLQERFVAEYLIDGNGTQAAIRAGLTGNPVKAGTNMMKKREVAKTIARERAAAAARLAIDADRIKAEMARIAFGDIGAVADWGPGGVTLKEKAEISPHDRAAIAELSSEKVEKTGAQRTYVKMHSKQRALEALAKLLGLFVSGPKAAAARRADAGGGERDANAILRERLLRIARAGEKKAEEKTS